MKDHEKRELVSRLTYVAREFADTEQLRARISSEVLPALEAVEAAERERHRRWADRCDDLADKSDLRTMFRLREIAAEMRA